VRTLTAAEVDDLTSRLRTHQRAVELDVADLVDFMLGTGLRIGEACAVRTGKNADGPPLLDREAGTLEVNATLVRGCGQGLRIQERPKSRGTRRGRVCPVRGARRVVAAEAGRILRTAIDRSLVVSRSSKTTRGIRERPGFPGLWLPRLDLNQKPFD